MIETAGNRGRWRGLVILLRQAGVVGVVVLGRVFGVKPVLEQLHGSAPGVVLTDLHTVADLQARFNAEVGTPRLILLLSRCAGSRTAAAQGDSAPCLTLPGPT